MRKGFTLVELLIVMAIIGIITAIALPPLLNARKRADQAAMAPANASYALNIKDLEKFPYLVSVLEASDADQTITFLTRATFMPTPTELVKFSFDAPSYLYIKDHMYIGDAKSILGLWKSEQTKKDDGVKVEIEKN